MNKLDLKNVKGSNDYGSTDEIIRNFISDTLRKTFAKYIALNKNINMPYKRYEIGKVFRDGPVKKGRVREFIQCDVDCVGIEGQMIESELISLYVEGYKELGIDVVIKYNNRKIMKGIIEECGIMQDKMVETITIIDKFEKLTKEEIIQEFLQIGLNKNTIDILIKYLNMNFEQIRITFKETENLILREGIREICELNEYIEVLNLNKYVSFTSTLARGQEYYTGTIFEVYQKEGYIKSSIGGGGRYDKMIGDFIDDGKSYPAVGISFGLDVIFEILKNKEKTKKNNTDVYIIPMKNKIQALKIADKFRKQKINVDIEMNEKKINDFIMKKHKNVEQVGFININGIKELQMAGGEFCENATRSAAYSYLNGKQGKRNNRNSSNSLGEKYRYTLL